MNKAKWIKPDVPLEMLALKLVEEVGEVAKEITNEGMLFGGNPTSEMSQMFRNHAVRELEHVEFIAKTLRRRIRDLK